MDAIKRVSEAEAEAGRIKADSSAAAKRMISEAETAGKAAYQACIESAEAKNKRLMSKSETRAGVERAEILKSSQAERDALKAAAEKKLQAAGELIVSRIAGR